MHCERCVNAFSPPVCPAAADCAELCRPLLQKEPTLSTDGGSRMPLLIDALQAGSELFSRGQDSIEGKGDYLGANDEVGLMLWGQRK